MLALAQQSNILDFPTVAPQGKSSEWYTPSRYIEAAREVMQGIDLDPASCELANRTVKATRYYTQAENGLAQEWYGRVWLNPPYGSTDGKSNMALWSQRLIDLYYSGNVQQALFLATGTPDRRWFQPLWNFLICFLNHQIVFKQTVSPYTGKSQDHHAYGSSIVYLGPNEQRFIDIFSQFGTIAKRVSQPRHTIATPSLWEVAQ